MEEEQETSVCEECGGEGVVEWLAGSFGGYPGSPDYRLEGCDECGSGREDALRDKADRDNDQAWADEHL